MADNKGNELKPIDFDCLINQMKLARLDFVVVKAAAIHFLFVREPKNFTTVRL